MLKELLRLFLLGANSGIQAKGALVSNNEEASALAAKDRLFTATVEEYKALRSEQVKRLEIADKALHYMVIITAAILGAFVSLFTKTPLEQNLAYSILLITPLIIAPLIFMAINNEIMIIRIGVYCYAVLRPQVVQLTNDANVWAWETFHVERSKDFLFQFGGFLRRLVFLVPVIMPIIAYLVLNPVFSSINLTLLIIDAALALETIVMLLYAVVVFSKAVRKGE